MLGGALLCLLHAPLACVHTPAASSLALRPCFWHLPPSLTAGGLPAALKQDIVDPEVLDDLEEGSDHDNAGSPYSDNRPYSEQLMESLPDDEEQPEYEQEYEYEQVEEDEGKIKDYAGCSHMCTCTCTCWTACGRWLCEAWQLSKTFGRLAVFQFGFERISVCWYTLLAYGLHWPRKLCTHLLGSSSVWVDQ